MKQSIEYCKGSNMKVIKIDLPEEQEKVEIHLFADEHIGDPHSDIKRLKERINTVANNPNAYCIMNGDIMDNATKTSIGDTYTSEFNPMQQLQTAVGLFSPIKKKILAITHALGFMYDTISYDDGMELCFDLLSACDELLVLSELSEGVKREIKMAKKMKIPIRYFEYG